MHFCLLWGELIGTLRSVALFLRFREVHSESLSKVLEQVKSITSVMAYLSSIVDMMSLWNETRFFDKKLVLGWSKN